jgi:hypothetical protein
MAVIRREAVTRWLAGYEKAWRANGTDQLAELFSAEVTYSPSPWKDPLDGLDELAAFWESERSGPNESFAFSSEIIALDRDVAVVRVSVDYSNPERRWRDLWVLRFAPGGRCASFEELPFVAPLPDGDQ